MKLKKDLDKYNKKELLDVVFSLVKEEAFEEEELNKLLDLDEEELRILSLKHHYYIAIFLVNFLQMMCL